MDRMRYDNLLNEINSGIKLNKKNIEDAIKEEYSKGTYISLEKISSIINSYKNVKSIDKPENKTIAVSYNGNPEITINYMLDSVLYNNRVVLCANGNNSINEILYNIFTDSLKGSKIANQWVDYSPEYNEIFLKDNQNKFEKIIYIGDYFEYQKFKTLFKIKVEYNNYGFLKLFIDKSKYKDEYKKIISFSHKNNIALEVYDDPDDFISENKDEDYSIIFADISEINQIQRRLRGGKILINAFPYDSYKFEINRMT